MFKYLISVFFFLTLFSVKLYSSELTINNWEITISKFSENFTELSESEQFKDYKNESDFKMPKDANRGQYIISYRKRFVLPERIDKKDAILLATPSDYPYIISINNEVIIRRGFPNTDYCLSDYKGVYQHIPEHVLALKDTLTIIMQTFPKGNSVPPPNISICNRMLGLNKIFWQSALNYSFISGLTFLAFFVFLIYLALWIGSKNTKMEYLYFSIASLCISIGYWNVVFSIPTIKDLPLWSVSRAMFGLAPTFLLMLITTITNTEKKMEKINTIILISAIIFSAAILIQKEKYSVENIFQIYTSFHVFPTLLLAMGIFAFKVRNEKDIKKWMVLIGFLATFSAAMHDLYFYKTFKLPYFWTIAYGYATLELSILLVLAGDLWDLFEENRKKAFTLKENNKILSIQSAKIEELNRARENFLNNMAHDLRTPLQGLLSSTELLNEKYQDESTSVVNDQFHNYLRNINNIIDFSTFNTLPGVMSLSHFSPYSALESLILQANREFRKFGSEIQLNCKEDFPKIVKGDKERFLRIIDNIFNVGINRYTSGILSIYLYFEDNRVKINLKCKDGLFFSPDLFSHLSTQAEDFDHTTVKDIRDLSLSAIYKITLSLNGSISFKNDSTLKLSFPFEPMNKQERELPVGNRILLVEDNKVNQIVIEKILEKEGYEILIAEDGIEGVESAINDSPDLILMDVQMPRMDGLEATRKIKEIKNIPIIALSAHAGMEECLDAGMDDYLSKPVHTVELLKKIENYLKIES